MKFISANNLRCLVKNPYKELATSTQLKFNRLRNFHTSPIAKAEERIKRQEPGKVVCGFIPEEFVTAFYTRTGFLGFPTFVFTFGTFLVSKEIYVLDHDYYNGLSIIILCIIAVTKGGPILSKFLDKEIDDYEKSWNEGRENEKKSFEQGIADELRNQEISEAQLMLLDAKRFNIALQLEEEYRKRLYHVYTEVKRRLDYQVELTNVERSIHHKNLVNWVVTEVRKQFTAEKDQEIINQCIQMLPEIIANEEKNKK